MPPPRFVRETVKSVVQVAAPMKENRLGEGQLSLGSGVFVDPRGLLITNSHVANPHKYSLKKANKKPIALRVTFETDKPPIHTFWAEIVADDIELDLCVLRVIEDVNGVKAKDLSFPFVRIDKSEQVEIGDRIGIVGYPMIGGKTVTFTSGRVSGFTDEPSISIQRGWIKTDAMISAGNSGGAAINTAGELIGIPTQVAAGSDIFPLDIRALVDTNADGIPDVSYVVGGFLNGLRPIKLAMPLLRAAAKIK